MHNSATSVYQVKPFENIHNSVANIYCLNCDVFLTTRCELKVTDYRARVQYPEA